jgi:hypothetical protein
MSNAMDEQQEYLLNIKQAAKFLNASEISLRRWSDAGKLHCVRIGGRRERRYRLHDLLAFLEQDSAGFGFDQLDAGQRAAHIVLEGIAIDYGKHLCSLYETDTGRLKLAIPFLLEGLQSGDRCFLVAAPDVQAHILVALRETAANVDQALATDQLICLDGKPSCKEMLAFFEDAFLNAGKQGIQGLRVLGDMAWIFQKNMDSQQLRMFETQYNAGLGKRFPVVSLCQYDARQFSGTAILGALKCHDDLFDYPLTRFLGT